MGIAEQRLTDEELHGPRVHLRAFEERDVDDIVVAASDPLTTRWLPMPSPYTPEHARSFITEFGPSMLADGTGILRAITRGDSLVGAIDAKRVDWRHRSTEVGYWSVPKARGAGLMTEALEVFARWLLVEQDLERVELRIAPGNAGSIGMARRAGFTFEGIARNAGVTHSGRVDLEVHSLVRGDLALD